jgi:Xaa-Pro aminopeptidase
VVLDFGGVRGSYCVDLTRTVVLGRASARARQVHEAVKQAQAGAIAAVRPGASRFDIDGAARVVLADLGMAEAFGHGIGHGLGIEVHEDPRVVQRKPGVDLRHEAVDVGMVFTIEPGAYFPGWGGVRIEDDVVVTGQGAELLTMVTSDLLEL